MLVYKLTGSTQHDKYFGSFDLFPVETMTIFCKQRTSALKCSPSANGSTVLKIRHPSQTLSILTHSRWNTPGFWPQAYSLQSNNNNPPDTSNTSDLFDINKPNTKAFYLFIYLFIYIFIYLF